MSHWSLLTFGVVIFSLCAATDAAEPSQSPLRHTVKSIDGKPVNLSKYKGRVVLIVNVASKCGLTPQYEQLQTLHEKYGPKGLSVLGFPCNQFGAQEPGSEKEIQQFCSSRYGVEFDLFTKVDVNGEKNAPLYKTLTGKGAKFPGRITWNFEKFLVNAEGDVIARFAPRVRPDDAKVVAAIETALAAAK